MILAAAVAAASLHATVAPANARPDAQVTVAVTGLTAAAADVVIHGGVASAGKMFGLVPMRRSGDRFWTVLRAPGLLGVYPVRVRAEGVFRETGALVEVLPRSFASETAVDTPAHAVEWWRRQAPAGATVASVAEWHAGFYFHRDQRYNRLLRVRFTLLGPWPKYRLAAGSYTRWFNVARTTAGPGGWKLVQLIPAP